MIFPSYVPAKKSRSPSPSISSKSTAAFAPTSSVNRLSSPVCAENEWALLLPVLVKNLIVPSPSPTNTSKSPSLSISAKEGDEWAVATSFATSESSWAVKVAAVLFPTFL